MIICRGFPSKSSSLSRLLISSSSTNGYGFLLLNFPIKFALLHSPLCNAFAAHHNSHHFKLFNYLLLCLINAGVSNLRNYSMWCLGRYTPTPSHLPLYINDETWFPLPTERFRRCRLPHLLHLPHLQGLVHSTFLLTAQRHEWDQIQELSNTGDISKFPMISVTGIFFKKDFSLYVFGFSIPLIVFEEMLEPKFQSPI